MKERMNGRKTTSAGSHVYFSNSDHVELPDLVLTSVLMIFSESTSPGPPTAATFLPTLIYSLLLFNLPAEAWRQGVSVTEDTSWDLANK